MPKACDLKRGGIVEIKGAPHVVRQVEAKSPSSRGAATLYKVRFTNLQTGQKTVNQHLLSSRETLDKLQNQLGQLSKSSEQMLELFHMD